MNLLGVFSRLKYANAGVAAWATLGPFSLALLLVLGAIVYANTPRADAKLFDQLGFLALISGALCLVSLGASLLF